MMINKVIFKGMLVNMELPVWAYGYLVARDNSDRRYIRVMQDRCEEWGGEKVTWIEYEVIPESIGQYIGKSDRDGQDVFEGDFCTFDVGVVNGFPLMKNQEGVASFDGIGYVPHSYCRNIKVIGNIHQYSFHSLKGDENYNPF